MGCCNKKNILEKLNEYMNDFYFRLIRQDFVVNQIKEFHNKTVKTYFEFWSLTKLLGIHTNLNFQVNFWELAYVSHADKNGIEGILFVFLLLCKADYSDKLRYVKSYLSVNINHSKEDDNNLIMTLVEFKKILFVYFSCLTTIPFESYIKTQTNRNLESEDLIKKKFHPDEIKYFTDDILKNYVKKNFYVNAGKFLDDKINLLVNDNEIRKKICNFVGSKKLYKKMSDEVDNTNTVENKIENEEINTEAKPLKTQNNKKKKKAVSCCSGSNSNKELIVKKDKKKK
jgi:hypothetical protein